MEVFVVQNIRVFSINLSTANERDITAFENKIQELLGPVSQKIASPKVEFFQTATGAGTGSSTTPANGSHRLTVIITW